MKPFSWKRLLLLSVLAITGALTLAAQEGEAKKEGAEKAEPSATLKWANFGLLVLGLGYLVAKTLPPAFRARNEEITRGISEAQALKKAAENRAAEVDARMSTLGKEIERLRAESKVEMQQEGERLRQETSRQIARVDAQAQQEIESATKLARRELKAYAAQLALNLAEQRLRAKIDAGTEGGLVDGFIQDLQHQPGREARN
jgi:F-type H+-transporting ATPase subunit b